MKNYFFGVIAGKGKKQVGKKNSSTAVNLSPNFWTYAHMKRKGENTHAIDINTPKSHFSDVCITKSPIHWQKRHMKSWNMSVTKQNKYWMWQALSYLSWSPTGFILKGDGLAHRGGLSSGTQWPWGSTTTLTTFGACSGWTMLLVVLDWDVGRGRGERWISCFFSFSGLSDSWIFSFNLYRIYRNKEENPISVPC